MDPLRVALEYYRMNEIDWSSSDESEDFPSQNFTMVTRQGYTAEKIAPVNRWRVDDCLAVPFMPTDIVSAGFLE